MIIEPQHSDLVTVEWVISRNPCYLRPDETYDEERIRGILGDGVTRIDSMGLLIPDSDLVWLFSRDGFLTPEEARLFTEKTVKRARSWGYCIVDRGGLDLLLESMDSSAVMAYDIEEEYQDALCSERRTHISDVLEVLQDRRIGK